MARNILATKAIATGVTQDGTSPGSSYALMPTSATSYDMGDSSQFVAFVTVLQAASGTSPTLDVRIQQSADMANWTTLVDFAQFTGAAETKAVSIPGPGTSDAKTFGRYIRFMSKTGGTTPVFTTTVTVAPKE